jgi:hypothetical protein
MPLVSERFRPVWAIERQRWLVHGSWSSAVAIRKPLAVTAEKALS